MTRPLRVGVQLPEVERRVDWPELRAMAVAAEESGFDSVWLGDHLLYRDDGRPERGPWDVWTTLAALAASTERVRLGPLVACAAFHPPGLIARMAAAIDEIGGGRFVLGIGAGWNRTEFDAFGIPYGERAARFEEAFEIVRRLLDGDRVTFDGRFHRTEDALLLPKPSRRTRLMVGSTGERVLRATLPHVDAWNTWWDVFGNRAEDFAKVNERISELAREVGRAPEEVERSSCALVVLDRSAGERQVPDGVTPLEGSTERIAQGVRELADAGADEVILVLSPNTERSIRDLAGVAG
ncbi:MAG TPA: LLM class flavin-dependent oxidoreductase [Actinomycetota bacterium]|nr:LLM class flavin-dependent oxidoreductase [Actinomycetota bacterium]